MVKLGKKRKNLQIRTGFDNNNEKIIITNTLQKRL